MESGNKTGKSVDEIDLLVLLANAIQTVKKNTALIVSTFLIGTGLGLVYFQLAPNVYESNMIITSDILTESYSKVLIENINKLIKEDNGTGLAEKLRLPLDKILSLKEVELESATKKSDGAESNKMYLTVTVWSTDNTIWPVLQKGLVDYLQQNEFVKIRVEQRKKYTTQIIEKIDLELKDLETLKAKVADGTYTNSSKDNLIFFDPTTFNTKILELNKEKVNLQNQLETINSVQIVDGFTVFKKQASPKLSISLIAGSTIGLILAGVVIAFRSIRAVLKFSEDTLANS